MFLAISPLRASTSMHDNPLAEPPIEGLQGIKSQSISMLTVASKTLQPIRLAAREASFTPHAPHRLQ